MRESESLPSGLLWTDRSSSYRITGLGASSITLDSTAVSTYTDATVCQESELRWSENTIMASADALQILEEAEVIAERRVREKIPEAASGIAQNKPTSIEA